MNRIIFTSSIVAVFNSSGTLTPEDWSTITTEQAIAGGAFPAYVKAKTEAEKAVWKFSEEHKSVDLTVCECFCVCLFGSMSLTTLQ